MFYRKNKKKTINTKFSFLVCLLFLLYFFSNNLIYAKSITKTENDVLIPIGNIIHIDTQLENVIVRNVGFDSPFIIGDEITNINDVKIKNYSDLLSELNSLSDNTSNINVTIKRNNHLINLKTSKEQ